MSTMINYSIYLRLFLPLFVVFFFLIFFFSQVRFPLQLQLQVHHEKFLCTEYEKSQVAADKIAVRAAYEGCQ